MYKYVNSLFLSLLWSTTCISAAAAQPSSLTELSYDEQQMLTWIENNKSEILRELTDQVNLNTGTLNTEGIDLYRQRLRAQLDELGFVTETREAGAMDVLACDGSRIQFADHLLASRSGKSPTRILLSGHMDTVFDQNDEFQTLEIDDNEILRGPGVADMKGGIVIMLYALRALNSVGHLSPATITVVLNSDEEMGSLDSRELLETLAPRFDIGLVFEGSTHNRAVNARKGLGQVRIKVTGRESHAGAAHEEGVSANLELAHKVVEIEKLTDYSTQSTVNVGVISGGEKRNTIAGCADAFIDLRFKDQASGEALQQSVKDIANKKYVEHENYPGLPHTEIWSTLHRPAKPPHETVDALIEQLMALSQIIGEPITDTYYSGGGTDGSILQGAGLPTFDSLGMDGLGAHSSRELGSVKSLIARTKLAAILLSRMIMSEQSYRSVLENE